MTSGQNLGPMPGEAAWITGQVINSEGGFRRWD